MTRTVSGIDHFLTRFDHDEDSIHTLSEKNLFCALNGVVLIHPTTPWGGARRASGGDNAGERLDLRLEHRRL